MPAVGAHKLEEPLVPVPSGDPAVPEDVAEVRRFDDIRTPADGDAIGALLEIKRELSETFQTLVGATQLLGTDRLVAAERFALEFLGAWAPTIIHRARLGPVHEDPGPDALVHFHAMVGALTQAKLAAVRGAGEEVRSYFDVAELLAWRARLPVALVVCGVPASGKSHLASALGDRSGLTVLGLEATRRTYAALGRAAAHEVGRTGGVIVDAAFHHATDRSAFRDGFGHAGAPLDVVECRAPADVLASRVRAHALRDGGFPDSGPGPMAPLRDDFEPLDDLSPGRHVTVRTDRVASDVVADVLALLDRRLGAGGT